MPGNLDTVIALSVILPIVFTVAALAIVGFFVVRLIGGSAQRRQVLASGVSAPATIVSVRETGVYINERPQVAVVLQV